MANVISSYLWILDTASPTAIWRSQVNIIEVYWKNPLTPGDLFSLTDLNANVIIDGRCEVASQSQVWKLDRWYNGLILPTLPSGILEITIK